MRDTADRAALLRAGLDGIEGVNRVEATYRIGGPVGAQSVVNLHTDATDGASVARILSEALDRCAAVLADAHTKGNLYLYCYDGAGMRRTLEELDEDLSVAISFSRLALRGGLC